MNKKTIITIILTLWSIMSSVYANASTNNTSSTKSVTNTSSIATTLPTHSYSNSGTNGKADTYENMIQNLTKDYYLVFFTSSRYVVHVNSLGLSLTSLLANIILIIR